MRDRCPHLLAAALLALLPSSSLSASPKLAAAPQPVQSIALGDSAVALTGPWKFSPGDSPWIIESKSGDSPLWAQSNFDDSHWTALDLTPPTIPGNPNTNSAVSVSGSSANGYPNLTGFAWYRLRLRVTNPNQSLSLRMPAGGEDAYQLYANGQFVGELGRFGSNPPTLFMSRPVVYTLPPPASNGEIELALRSYIAPADALNDAGSGGMREPPVLALSATAQLIQSAQITAAAHSRFGALLTIILFLLMAPASLWGWLQNRRERTFLWLFLAQTVTVALIVLLAVTSTTYWISASTTVFWLEVVLNPIWLPLWIMVWWYWFGLNKKRWIPIAAWLMAAASMLIWFRILSSARALAFLPSALLHILSPQALNDASLAMVVGTSALLLVVLFEGFLRDTTEALLAALPILLLALATLSGSLTPLLKIPFPTLTFFGLGIDAGSLSSILTALIIGALFLRRLVRTNVERGLYRQTIERELEQARELQQRVLVADDLHSPSFTIESEYRPAQVVGGDFYQTMLGLDGSLLIVIGDVSGKGISAAMLVAVLVGAIRTRANDSFDPVSMLAILNNHLVGRSGGHLATCLVAHLRPNGQLRMASSGHLPPYLNGVEVELAGSLPLGLAGKVEPATLLLQLQSGDSLTFMTDGVVEARDKRGRLFGFERACSISRDSAADIALQAQRFGQDDDITVLRVSYTGVPQRESTTEVPIFVRSER